MKRSFLMIGVDWESGRIYVRFWWKDGIFWFKIFSFIRNGIMGFLFIVIL